jgi:pimeloyl-ACP methyl ester carboxylesterase
VSFSPTGFGHVPFLVFDGWSSDSLSAVACTDNVGQVWTNLGGGLNYQYFLPRQTPPGLTSITCSSGGATEPYSLLFFELSGIDPNSPHFRNVSTGPEPIQCGFGADTIVKPVVSLFYMDILGISNFARQDTITPVNPSPGLASAFGFAQSLFNSRGEVAEVDTKGIYSLINESPVSSPTFSYTLIDPLGGVFVKVSCTGVTFAPSSIVDPFPDLMNGFNVVAPSATVGQSVGADLLASRGRAVSGIAADGVTEVLIRVPATNVGDSFTFAVLDADGQASVRPSEDGTLGNPGDANQSISQSQVSTFAIGTAQGPYAFAVYRAPLDFPRAGGIDENSSTRTIRIEAVGDNNSSQLPITIVRPPVAMVHGLWSNWETWNNFAPLVLSANTVDPRFSVLRVNYDTLVGPQITATDPVFFAGKVQKIRANSLGFAYNAPTVLSQMSGWLSNFRSGNNPANIPVAASQFDVIAHSMGGVISRTLLLTPGYLNNSNFGRGVIHKLITIDSPHLGSDIAAHVLGAENNCFRRWFGAFGKFALRTATFANSPFAPVSGALGDMTIGSGPLLALQAVNPNPGVPPIPTATIAGEYTNWGSLDAGPDTGSIFTIKTACVNDGLVQSLTSTGWPAIFAAEGDARNDALVSVTSELAGLPDDAGFHFPGFVHTTGLAGPFGLGFTLPSVLDGNTAISTQVVLLLNVAIPSSPDYKNLGPSSQ